MKTVMTAEVEDAVEVEVAEEVVEVEVVGVEVEMLARALGVETYRPARLPTGLWSGSTVRASALVKHGCWARECDSHACW